MSTAFLAAHRTPLLLLAATLAIVAACGVALLLHRPRNDRDWSLDQAVLPSVELAGEQVTVHAIRDFVYRSETDYTPRYYDRTFDVGRLLRIYYVVEPFTSFKGPAHTFLSFEFEGEQFLAVSIEIRKRRGQSFQAWRSIFPYYELMYVVADESDVIKLRSNVRKDTVFVYPVKADAAARRGIFLDYMARVNQLRDHPEFYDLLTDNCTTNIVDSVNRATGKHIPWSYQVLLPSYSDDYALRMGLLDTDLPLAAARARYQINARAAAYADDPRFSAKIRAPAPTGSP
ncbi:MAG TPA: DUF4105 domain-containing protein [Polyangia bacterium]